MTETKDFTDSRAELERVQDIGNPEKGRQITDADIERRFTYHRPEGQKITAHDDVRIIFKRIAQDLNEMVPDGREKALLYTKLEEAANWAHAAIAREGK